MEQKAKRVGKFNIIDILAVILIVLVVALVGWKLAGRSGGEGAAVPMAKVTYTVKAEGVPVELYENCQKHLPSPLMASGELVGGQIESVEKEKHLELAANGTWVEDESKTDLIFTVTTETPKGAVMTTKVGDQEVRVGKTDYILKSEYIELSKVTITDVQWEDVE